MPDDQDRTREARSRFSSSPSNLWRRPCGSVNALVAPIHTGSIEWSILHTLNDFLFHHDAVEDPLLVYVNASEALFVGILVLVFLFANGERHRAWRRATVAAMVSPTCFDSP